MKIKNIFKTTEKNAAKVTVQKLDKTQLEKVIGGADTNTKIGSIPIVGGVVAGAAD
jgi:hypothetical protein